MLKPVKTWVFICRVGFCEGLEWVYGKPWSKLACSTHRSAGSFPDLSCRFPRNLRRFESSPGGWRHWWKKQSTWRRPWCSSAAQLGNISRHGTSKAPSDMSWSWSSLMRQNFWWFLIVLSVVDIVLGCFWTPFWGCISSYICICIGLI